jgi:hypothetical protein
LLTVAVPPGINNNSSLIANKSLTTNLCPLNNKNKSPALSLYYKQGSGFIANATMARGLARDRKKK